jgi:hypothetical protein
MKDLANQKITNFSQHWWFSQQNGRQQQKKWWFSQQTWETKNEPFWLNPAKMEIEPTALGIEHDLL